MKLTVNLLLSLTLVFWNVENFFYPAAESGNPSENEFTPCGGKRWTWKRFRSKCDLICKTIFAAGDFCGSLPDIICLEEVENDAALKALAHGTLLDKCGYRYVHFDSRDPRGIDCALLYRRGIPAPDDAFAVPLILPGGDTLRTRDILCVRFGTLAVLVNHHPSKLGPDSGSKRLLALNTLHSVCDSLASAGCSIIAVGDFNDTPSSLSDSLMAPMKEIFPKGWPSGGCGTIKFSGNWQLIDRCFVSNEIDCRTEVFSPEFLCEPDRRYGGVKPKRTYSGPRYRGGASDHLPVCLYSEFLFH